MYRFLVKPKWVGFHLLCIAAIVAMVNLGFWQLRRLDERRTFNSEVRERTAQPAADLSVVLVPDADPGDVEWRTVSVSGTYLADEQIVVVNRGQEGQAGVNVLTPLDLGDGRSVLVNRGFVPSTATVPPPPSGPVAVEGRLRSTQERGVAQLSDPASGELREVQRIDIPRLAAQLPGEVLPMYVDLLASVPTQASSPVPLPDPALAEGPHLSYAIQWFLFSTAVVIGWVLAVRRSATRPRPDGPTDPTGQAPQEAADRRPTASAPTTAAR